MLNKALLKIIENYGYELSPLPKDLQDMPKWHKENEHIFIYNDILKAKGQEEADKYMCEVMHQKNAEGS